METDITTPAPAPTVEQASDAAQSPAQLFRYSRFVHVGAGAEDCPHATDGECDRSEHFHAWVRLPNQFQHSDIRQRAQAAKARRIRQLHDPESDSSAILEADMEELLRAADKAALVDELVNVDWWKDHLEAMREVETEERFEHITRDRERVQQINEMDPGSRPTEELQELQRHVAAYGEAVEAKRDEIQAPRRQALEALSVEQLVDEVRKERINAEATAAFMESYTKWEWFAGTYRPAKGRPVDRMYTKVEELENESPEILDGIRDAYQELEQALQRGPTGN